MNYVESSTALAETYLGDYKRFREYLNVNPQILGYQLPPSLQQPIDQLGKLGIKIPSVQGLQKVIDDGDKRLTKMTANLFFNDKTSTSVDNIGTPVKTVQEQLKQLDWLL
jgi:hypothetical protein